MTKDSFCRHCERFEESRGNLKCYFGTFSTAPLSLVVFSAGIFGLMDAIDTFDPTVGVKFETYCSPRIRGSILDELRSTNWVPRLAPDRAHQLDMATRRLETDISEIGIVRDGRSRDPITEAQKRSLKNLLTKGLTRAERLIVVLYYYKEYTMKEIGSTLDIPESRVSQMHSSIIAKLKSQIGGKGKDFKIQ